MSTPQPSSHRPPPAAYARFPNAIAIAVLTDVLISSHRDRIGHITDAERGQCLRWATIAYRFSEPGGTAEMVARHRAQEACWPDATDTAHANVIIDAFLEHGAWVPPQPMAAVPVKEPK